MSCFMPARIYLKCSVSCSICVQKYSALFNLSFIYDTINMFMLTIKVYFLYNTISNICYIYYILIIHYTNYITLWVYRRRQWHPTPVLLPGESHGWRSLVGSVHGVSKVRTRLTRLHFHFSLSCTGEGNGSPLQCSCLENPRDGGAWWAAVYGVA